MGSAPPSPDLMPDESQTMKKPSKNPEQIAQALAALLLRIEAEQEFPDAAWAVSRAHGVDYQALSDAYDAHHGA